jgi:hypothetical protein
MNLFPGNFFRASNRLKGRLNKEEKNTAVSETEKESKTILKTSLSKEIIKPRALFKALRIFCIISPQ